MEKDTYTIRNHGYITASKLKCYIKNPAEYYVKYVKMVELETEKRYFILWTAFDDLITFWQDFFMEKYYIDEGLLVEDLRQELLKKNPEDRYNWSDTAVRQAKLPVLRWLYYRDPAQKKVRLTPWEGDTIVWMYKESMRQKIADVNGVYWKRVKITIEYMGVKLRGELDRLVFVDKNSERYLPEFADKYIIDNGRDKWLEFVEENWIYAVIRDWKTSGNIDNIEFDIEETFDYVLSMAFYYVLVYVHYGVSSKYVMLDVLGKREPYPYIWYMLKENRIKYKIDEFIKPWIQSLINSYKYDMRHPQNAITGQPVDRYIMMKSPYYAYMDETLQTEFVAPN